MKERWKHRFFINTGKTDKQHSTNQSIEESNKVKVTWTLIFRNIYAQHPFIYQAVIEVQSIIFTKTRKDKNMSAAINRITRGLVLVIGIAILFSPLAQAQQQRVTIEDRVKILKDSLNWVMNKALKSQKFSRISVKKWLLRWTKTAIIVMRCKQPGKKLWKKLTNKLNPFSRMSRQRSTMQWSNHVVHAWDNGHGKAVSRNTQPQCQHKAGLVDLAFVYL